MNPDEWWSINGDGYDAAYNDDYRLGISSSQHGVSGSRLMLIGFYSVGLGS